MQAPEENGKPPEPSRKYQAIAFGYTFTAGMFIFTMLGYWIDKKRGGNGGWTLVRMFAGLAYGGYELWKLVSAISRQAEEE